MLKKDDFSFRAGQFILTKDMNYKILMYIERKNPSFCLIGKDKL